VVAHVNREDPAIIALGQRVENEIVNRLYKNRADNPVPAERPWRSEPWTIELRTTEANAWLSSRLPKWLANQKDNFRWPKDVSGVQVEFERSRIMVGAKVSAGSRDQVLSATLEPASRAMVASSCPPHPSTSAACHPRRLGPRPRSEKRRPVHPARSPHAPRDAGPHRRVRRGTARALFHAH
jgi:hypothetical protein